MTCWKQIMSAAEQIPEWLVVKCYTQVRTVILCNFHRWHQQSVCHSHISPFLLEQALVHFAGFIVFPIWLLCQASVSVGVYPLHTLSWWSRGSNQLLSNYDSAYFSDCKVTSNLQQSLQYGFKEQRDVGNDKLMQWTCIYGSGPKTKINKTLLHFTTQSSHSYL